MAAGELRGLNPRVARVMSALLRAARASGIRVQVTSVRRSRTKQARLYRAYLRGDHPLPVAAPGTSYHQRGLAVDLVTSPNVNSALGRIWERLGGTYGGRFNDPVHFDARPR